MQVKFYSFMQIHSNIVAPGLAVAGFLLAAGVSGNAQTVIYSDNFQTPDTSSFDSAPLAGRLSGVDASLVYGQSGGAELSISGNQLSMPATYSYVEMRFNNTGQTGGSGTNLFDWSTGSGGTAITAAGGMNVSFTITAPDTTNSNNWISLSVGAGNVDNTGVNGPRVNHNNTSAGILFRDSGGTAIFNNGVEYTAGEGSITPISVTHSISIYYEFNSWAAGAPVTMAAYEDGTLVGTDSFTWDYSNQYIDLGYNSPNAGSMLVGSFTITTVPEPTTWAMMLGGFGGLAFIRRFRGRAC